MDRRVRRTKEHIKEAFWQLIEKKEIHQITVAELCEIADINRSTFYQYYADIYAVFEEQEHRYFCQFQEVASRVSDMADPTAVMRLILQYIRENRKSLLFYYQNQHHTQLFEQAYSMLNVLFRNKIHQFYQVPADFPKEKLDFLVDFITAGCYRIYLKCLKEEQIQIDDLAEEICQVSDACLSVYFKVVNENRVQRF